MGREADFVAEVQADVKQFLEVYHRLHDKQLEWNALDYGNTISPEDIAQVTMAGGAVEPSFAPADVGAVVFGTMDAITAVLTAGHSTNLHKML